MGKAESEIYLHDIETPVMSKTIQANVCCNIDLKDFLNQDITNVFLTKPHNPYELKSDAYIDRKRKLINIFLAGTIDMGNSRDWQSDFIEIIKQKSVNSPISETDIQIFNPRRNSGKGFDGKFNKGEMEYQVNWELEHLEKSDIIIMNLLPDSKSPISLLEMGLFHDCKRLWIICPKEYYRYDNVRIVCQRYKIHLFDSEENFWKFFDTIFKNE